MGRMNRPADQTHLEDLLDEALAGTFPASDPVSGLVSGRPTRQLENTLPKRGSTSDESEQKSD